MIQTILTIIAYLLGIAALGYVALNAVFYLAVKSIFSDIRFDNMIRSFLFSPAEQMVDRMFQPKL